MESFFNSLRWVHVVGGSIVLLLGLLQIILPKRGARHRTMGVLYLWTMVVVSLSAIALSSYRIATSDNYFSAFLFVIGLFSLYLVVSGYRFGHNKNNAGSAFDKTWSYTGILFGILLLGVSAWMFFLKVTSVGIIALVFGTIQLWSGIEDHGYFVKGRRKKQYGPLTWHFTHLGRMIGSYIAATTAFLVNVVQSGPMILKWLGPTVVGSIVIAGFTRYYTRKFGLKKNNTH